MPPPHRGPPPPFSESVLPWQKDTDNYSSGMLRSLTAKVLEAGGKGLNEPKSSGRLFQLENSNLRVWSQKVRDACDRVHNSDIQKRLLTQEESKPCKAHPVKLLRVTTKAAPFLPLSETPPTKERALKRRNNFGLGGMVFQETLSLGRYKQTSTSSF